MTELAAWARSYLVFKTDLQFLRTAVLRIVDTADTTKRMLFDLSGITTATTRTYTFPDASGTILLDGQATIATPVALDLYVDLKERLSEQHMHGNLVALDTGSPLDSVPTDITVTNGLSKLIIVVNAGSDLDGEITVTGTSVDRNTGATTGSDTDTITVDALTTDDSGTDANGNVTHDFTGAYITSKWFLGSVTLSTTDLTLTDVDTYQVSFEQFDDYSDLTLTTFDATLECNHTNGWADLYLYLLNVTGDKCNIASIADVHVTTAQSTANTYYRLRRGNLAQAINGSTDGIWVEASLGPLASNYWEDITVKVWAYQNVVVQV